MRFATGDEMIGHLKEVQETAIVLDGLDDAIVGLVERKGMPCVLLYDYDKCIEILLDQGVLPEGATDEEKHAMAVEHMEFNVVDAWYGEKTPAFVHALEGRVVS